MIQCSIYYEQGKYEQAIADLNRALNLTSNQFAYYTRRDCTSNTDYKVLRLFPNKCRIYIKRARVYRFQGKLDQAIADATQAIKDLEAVLNMNPFGYKLKEKEMAGELKKMLAEAYLLRGKIYSFKKAYDQAIADASKVIEFWPDFVAYADRGWAYMLNGLYDEAITDYTKAIELMPLMDNNRWETFVYEYNDYMTVSRRSSNMLSLLYVDRGWVYNQIR